MQKQQPFVTPTRRRVVTVAMALSLAILQTWMHPDSLTAQSVTPGNQAVPYSLPVLLPNAKASLTSEQPLITGHIGNEVYVS